ncbi:hypothetical protein EYF80_000315 [Liparis tanakae]|uniref:Uncharacterized protein n=1 Tax=Liparis tanakae TaxID=230148 RepID=A0A4Z2JKC4_9TELE|nr:hypothetical protein EYF80_000315 [Liparis tanakae]
MAEPGFVPVVICSLWDTLYIRSPDELHMGGEEATVIRNLEILPQPLRPVYSAVGGEDGGPVSSASGPSAPRLVGRLTPPTFSHVLLLGGEYYLHGPVQVSAVQQVRGLDALDGQDHVSGAQVGYGGFTARGAGLAPRQKTQRLDRQTD